MRFFCSLRRKFWLLSIPGLTLAAAAAGGLAAESEGTAPAPSWTLGLGSSLYAYQTEDLQEATTDHTLFLQRVNGSVSGLAGGRIAVRASGRFSNLPLDPPPGFTQSRLYTGYADARLSRQAQVRVGRQFLANGTAVLTLDGARLTYRSARGWRAEAWAGAKAPPDLGGPGDFDQDTAVGGSLGFVVGGGHRVTLGASLRERDGRTAQQSISCEYTGPPVAGVRAFVRTVYDLETERWLKLQAQTQWRGASRRSTATFQFIDRYPSIDAASWYARFNCLKRITLVRGAFRWQNEKDFGGELELTGSFVGERETRRLGLAALLPGARIGFALRGGDQGDEQCFYGELYWQALPWLRLEGQASHLTYALLADAPGEDERELITMAVRARARLRPGLNLTTEIQRLENPQYDQDVRLLVGMDMGLGRGSSRFGLDRGGWLP